MGPVAATRATDCEMTTMRYTEAEVEALVSAAYSYLNLDSIDCRPGAQRLRARLKPFIAVATTPSTPEHSGVPVGGGTFQTPAEAASNASCSQPGKPQGSVSSTGSVGAQVRESPDGGVGAVGGPAVTPLMAMAREIVARFEKLERRVDDFERAMRPVPLDRSAVADREDAFALAYTLRKLLLLERLLAEAGYTPDSTIGGCVAEIRAYISKGTCDTLAPAVAGVNVNALGAAMASCGSGVGTVEWNKALAVELGKQGIDAFGGAS